MSIPALTKGHKGEYFPIHPEKYKGKTPIIWRSTWERHVMKTLDMNPNVLEWSSETIVIPYLSPVDNQMHRYFPDMWARVRRENGTTQEVLIEVKPFKQTMPPPSNKRRTKKLLIEQATYLVNQAKWESARAYCRKRGWEFIIMTEKRIFKK